MRTRGTIPNWRAVLLCVLGVSALGVLTVAAIAHQTGWAGIRSERTLRAGDSLKISSGLGIHVSQGWTGRYVTYFTLPSWLPLGDAADLARVDMVELNGEVDGADLQVVIASLRRDGPGAARIMSRTQKTAVPAGQRFVAYLTENAHTNAVSLVASVSSTHDIAHVSIMPSVSMESSVAAELVWNSLSVEGVSLP